jgi:hypothetical protein
VRCLFCLHDVVRGFVCVPVCVCRSSLGVICVLLARIQCTLCSHVVLLLSCALSVRIPFYSAPLLLSALPSALPLSSIYCTLLLHCTLYTTTIATRRQCGRRAATLRQ